MDFAWVFLTFGWVGSILAVVAFEFGFKSAQSVVEERAADEEVERELLIQRQDSIDL